MNALKTTFLIFLPVCPVFMNCSRQGDLDTKIIQVLGGQEIEQAEMALLEEPVTITQFTCPRSSGGKHDFYSEGDYWWPDPEHPEGPYIRRDGMTNPENFTDHRRAMIRLSQIIGSLASAYGITGDEKYVRHAFRHLEAWFVDTSTMMNPSLLYAQAIQGRFTGRGTGIIDTIHLIEIAQGILVLEKARSTDRKLLFAIKNWFAMYLEWLTSHPYGIDEMNAENNHGTCWVMQVSSFARLTGNDQWLEFCRDRYKNVLLPGQMSGDGSFHRELERTKPYGYSLFNLDAMATVCQILSTSEDNLWNYQMQDGRGIKKGIVFMAPYVKHKENWPYEPDVMYWKNWPVAHPFLVFGAKAFKNREWLEIWEQLDHSPQVDEVVRNLPVRNPIIWLNI